MPNPIDNNNCGICKDTLDIPHALPCKHCFCFICISRHLCLRNFCPLCLTGPYTMAMVETECVRSNRPRIPEQIFKRTAANYMKVFKQFHVSTEGSLRQLEARFAELSRQLQLEQFREIPASKIAIARRVHITELSGAKKATKDYGKIQKRLVELKNKLSRSQIAQDRNKESLGIDPPR